MSDTQTLDEMISSANKELPDRKPLLNFSENVEEIREICLRACPYVREMNNELLEPEPWEVLIQGVIYVLKETFAMLNDNKSPDVGEVFIEYGTLMKIAISAAVTRTADKVGTYNPCIYVGKELEYGFSDYNDLMTSEMAQTLKSEGLEFLHPMFFEQREQIKDICERASRRLESEMGIQMFDYESLTYFVVAFFRKAKEYLVEHKDEDMQFYIGRLIKMGIEKHKDGTYFIYVTPAQEFKMENAKGDGGAKGTETLK